MIVQEVENTPEVFRHWLRDTETGEVSGKAGYSGFCHLNGHVGFTAYYGGKEGVLTSDEFCKMAATAIKEQS